MPHYVHLAREAIVSPQVVASGMWIWQRSHWKTSTFLCFAWILVNAFRAEVEAGRRVEFIPLKVEAM